MIDPRELESFFPLGDLSSGNRNRLARNLDWQTAEAGAYLFHAGDPSPSTLYLAEGTVALHDDIGHQVLVHGGEATAAQPLAPASVRAVSARCVSVCRYLVIDSELLDVMLAWDQGRGLDTAGANDAAAGDEDWMVRLLQMPIFHRVPPANLYVMFRSLEAITAPAGAALVRQGDRGDYFYVIVEGAAVVTRDGPAGTTIVLAELDAGSCFGEEALISEAPRNATVTMTRAGRLMRLDNRDFQRLLKDPLARTIGYRAAVERIDAGTARWLDVRLPAEYRTGSLSRSINLPLHLLRLKLAQLDPAITYLTICDTGRRSSIAAWLLNQRGFDAYQLESGLPAGD